MAEQVRKIKLPHYKSQIYRSIIITNYFDKKVSKMVSVYNSSPYQECSTATKKVKRDEIKEEFVHLNEKQNIKQQEVLMVQQMGNLQLNEDSASSDVFTFKDIRSSLECFQIQETKVLQRKYKAVFRKRIQYYPYYLFQSIWLNLKKRAYLRRIQVFHRHQCLHPQEEFGDQIFQKMEASKSFSNHFEHIAKQKQCVAMNFLKIMKKQLQQNLANQHNSLIEANCMNIMLIKISYLLKKFDVS